MLEGDGVAVAVGGQIHDAHGAASQALLQPIAHRTGQPMGAATRVGRGESAGVSTFGAPVCPQCVHRVTSGLSTTKWSIFVTADR